MAHILPQLLTPTKWIRWASTVRSKNLFACDKIFAGLDALAPCVIKVWVAGISTVLEPSTTGSAATELARFLGDAPRTLSAVDPGIENQSLCRR